MCFYCECDNVLIECRVFTVNVTMSSLSAVYTHTHTYRRRHCECNNVLIDTHTHTHAHIQTQTQTHTHTHTRTEEFSTLQSFCRCSLRVSLSLGASWDIRTTLCFSYTCSRPAMFTFPVEEPTTNQSKLSPTLYRPMNSDLTPTPAVQRGALLTVGGEREGWEHHYGFWDTVGGQELGQLSKNLPL